MRILYISSSRVPSKDANSVHVMRMCDALSDLGHEVVLLARRTPESSEEAHLRYGTRHGFSIVRLPWPLIRFGGLIYGLRVLLYVCSHRRPSLVLGRNLQGVLAAAALGLPVIYESHAPPSSGGRRRAEQWLCRRQNLRALVVITRALAKRYRDFFPSSHSVRVIVAPDAADLPEVADLASPVDWPGRADALQVGYAGHLYEGRGIDLLVELGRDLPEIDLHLVGGAEDDLARWRAQPLPTNVHFHGFVDPREVPAYLGRCDILVAPYQERVAVRGGGDTSEWMSPMKLFEYMAAGRAIVASRLSAIEEILENGRNALLVAANDLEAWRSALVRLRDDDELRAALESRARGDVEAEYTWVARAQRILEAACRPDPTGGEHAGRVLHILSSSGVGGTEVSTLRLACETRRELQTSFCLLADRGPISEAIEHEGFPLEHVPAGSPGEAIRALPTLLRLLRRSDAQIVHTYGLRAHLLGRAVGRLAGKGCIVGGLRSLTGTSSQGERWLCLDRLTFGLSRGYISNSQAALEQFAEKGYPRERLWCIHNGIDLEHFRPADDQERRAARAQLGVGDGRFVLACVASLRAVKNHRLLLEAIACMECHPLLLLIGEGALRNDLERLVSNHGLADRVRFVGPLVTAELPAHLAAADACVLTSEAEGLPTSLLEAMACGLPVIATNVGGVSELVVNGETGSLVSSGDADGLCRALNELATDPERRRRMGRAGRARAEADFSLRRMADGYVDLYRKLIGGDG